MVSTLITKLLKKKLSQPDECSVHVYTQTQTKDNVLKR